MISITQHYSALAVTISLLLSGCSLAPDYHRPASAIPTQWNQQEIAVDTPGAQAMPDLFFSDVRLQQLIALTLDNNKDLAISALNLQKSGVQYGVEQLANLPHLGFSAQETVAHEPAGIFDTVDTGAITYHQYDVKLVSASWEVDLWGRLRSLKQAALDQYLAAEASSRAVKISLIGQTVSAWLIYIADREKVHLTEQKLDNTLQLQRMQQLALQAGGSTPERVLEAMKASDNVRSELAQHQLQAQQDYNALTLLVGAPLPPALFSEVSLEQAWTFPRLKAGTPSQVLLRRPDIIAAEYQLKAANANIGAARAAFFPSITLSAEGGSSTAVLSKLLAGGTMAWSFIPAINLPIFDGGKNQANLSLAELNKKTEIVNYQQRIQQAFRDVSDALAGQAALQQQNQQIARLVEASRKQYQMAQASRAAGQISTQDLIQKRNALLDLRQQQLDVRLKYLIQGAKLYSVLGGDRAVQAEPLTGQ